MISRLLNNVLSAQDDQGRFERTFICFFWVSFSLFLFFYGIQPLYDPDFWWHLKSGEYMVQHGGLLQTDPFTFSGDGVLSNREAIILRGYWLWQLAAYGFYSLFALNGIFLLNLCTVGVLAGVVIQQMRRQQIGYATAFSLMTLGFFLLSVLYPLERPQVASFLFATILLALLIRVRDGGLLDWTLPLLMLLWANLHGGFVVGDILLLCFAAGAVLEYRRDLPRLRQLLFWVGIGIGASLLNPNGALPFGELISFNKSALMLGIAEYQSTLSKFQSGVRFIAILWLLIVLYGFGIWSSRRIYWPELFVGLFLAYFSVEYVRNVGFFSIAMLPLIGGHLHEGARHRQWRLPSGVLLFLMALCTTFLLWATCNFWQERQGVGPVQAIYPEKAINFFNNSRLQGRIFNDYTHGGYLLWGLSPQFKIFIDGRGLEAKVFDDWQKISAARTKWVDGRKEYEGLLDAYAVDYIIQPIYDFEGNIQPLMKGLHHNPEWVPIFLDQSVYILARLSAKNAETISPYCIDKNEFNARLLQIVNELSESSPQVIGYQVARAGMLAFLGRYDEAKAQVDKIRTISPEDPSLPALQRDLAILRVQRMY